MTRQRTGKALAQGYTRAGKRKRVEGATFRPIGERSLTSAGLVRISVSLAPDVFKRFQALATENRSCLAEELRIAAEIGLEQQTGELDA